MFFRHYDICYKIDNCKNQNCSDMKRYRDRRDAIRRDETISDEVKKELGIKEKKEINEYTLF